MLLARFYPFMSIKKSFTNRFEIQIVIFLKYFLWDSIQSCNKATHVHELLHWVVVTNINANHPRDNKSYD